MYSTQTANMLMLAMSDETRQKEFDNRAYSRWEFETAEEANAKLPFAFSIPDDALTGKPTLIYVTKAEPYDRQLCILYAGGINGINFRAILEPNKPDFRAHVDQWENDMEAGVCKLDKAPKLIDIGDYEAFAVEPGFNNIEGDKIPRIGVVQWWENDVFYSIYGTRGPSGTSVNEMTKIAQSVINSKTLIAAGIQLSPQDLERFVNSQTQPEEMNNEKTEQQEYE